MSNARYNFLNAKKILDSFLESVSSMTWTQSDDHSLPAGYLNNSKLIRNSVTSRGWRIGTLFGVPLGIFHGIITSLQNSIDVLVSILIMIFH